MDYVCEKNNTYDGLVPDHGVNLSPSVTTGARLE